MSLSNRFDKLIVPENLNTTNDFLRQLEAAIDAELSNEQFGVSELADAIGMSRSNLLRKVKSLTGKSASQFIREVRLARGMDLLKSSDLNVSEVAYQVGFGSPSYFIKCFREHYGYPPGEANKHVQEEILSHEPPPKSTGSLPWLLTGAMVLVLLALFLWPEKSTPVKNPKEKSIAVLPFKNDSNDSTNQYLINGLMESILNNLQKIEDLRVVSRTSVEKYRTQSMTIPEIAKELNVSYFVEGSGQKIGNQILLNIQLIDGETDNHLWAEQYSRETLDIFQLQQEISKSIASSVQAVITPQEAEQIEKIPTENLVAYDHYLKGVNFENIETEESLEQAVVQYKKAIELDPQFALAYAHSAFSYYKLDFYKQTKVYTEDLAKTADKALLLDPNRPESLVAKGLYYMQIKEYALAEPQLEKALTLAPNSASITNILSDFYTSFMPNTKKYLEYALKGIQLNVTDSVTASYIYLHLSNALIQNGFVDEALRYINMSLDYNPQNYFSPYVKAFIRFAKHRDVRVTLTEIKVELAKDTTRLDMMQDIAKLHYVLAEYDSAYKYYSKFIFLRETYGLDIYRHEHARVAWVMKKTGRDDLAEYYINDYLDYVKSDNTIYQPLNWAGYYEYMNEPEKALEEIRKFTKAENYQFWIADLFGQDPMSECLEGYPEYKELAKVIHDKFWKEHEVTRKRLEELDLL